MSVPLALSLGIETTKTEDNVACQPNKVACVGDGDKTSLMSKGSAPKGAEMSSD